MAVTITHKAEDVSASSEGKVTTVERVMIAEADSIIEIATSKAIPQPDSRHPYDSTFKLINRNFEQVGNVGRRVQSRITLTYSNEGNVDDGKKQPWELDAQNVQVGYTTEPSPLLYGYNREGIRLQLLNSAGSRLLIEGQSIIRQISFTFCVKDGRSGEAPINNAAIINKSSEKAAGYTFEKFCAMLMPMNANFIQDVDDEGEIYRRYWQIEAVILENNNSWEREALDVGTMAVFKDGEAAQPIYQYTPWTSLDPTKNLGIAPTFGSIDDVLRAKIRLANSGSSSDWNKNFDSLPYSEVTEPLPLINGRVYIEAIKNPQAYPYKKGAYFESKPGSWNKYDLPSKRA